jgi:hypothetical protein
MSKQLVLMSRSGTSALEAGVRQFLSDESLPFSEDLNLIPLYFAPRTFPCVVLLVLDEVAWVFDVDDGSEDPAPIKVAWDDPESALDDIRFYRLVVDGGSIRKRTPAEIEELQKPKHATEALARLRGFAPLGELLFACNIAFRHLLLVVGKLSRGEALTTDEETVLDELDTLFSGPLPTPLKKRRMQRAYARLGDFVKQREDMLDDIGDDPS